ncbi:MAG: bacteriophage abortive infection AbiH family protein [Oscillospiraceae bacterium]|nr:bacteriophage abortive infection AbiH family protein [Oscillospiraceae bacterium]
MNITFLIGNGFDLNMGLKTSFKDFLPVYLEKNKETDSEIIKKFKEDINKDIETWANFEEELGKYARNFDEETQLDFVECLDDFRVELAEYLKEQTNKIDYDFHEEEIRTKFTWSVQKFYEALPQDSKDIIMQLIKPHKPDENSYCWCNFISFNYTDVINECIRILFYGEIGNEESLVSVLFVKNIHGTLDENMIIGVDNEKQIHNPELSKDEDFKRVLVKPLLKNFSDNLGVADADHYSQLIRRSDIVCVFGMSIGVTDKTWWERIGEWLQEHEKHQLVLFNVNYADKRIPAPTSYVTCKRKTEEQFFKLSDIPKEQRKELRKRIHIGLNTELFKVDLTKTPDPAETKEPVLV